MRHTKKWESMTHTQWVSWGAHGEQSIETVPEKAKILELADKVLKSAIINVFK